MRKTYTTNKETPYAMYINPSEAFVHIYKCEGKILTKVREYDKIKMSKGSSSLPRGNVSSPSGRQLEMLGEAKSL